MSSIRLNVKPIITKELILFGALVIVGLLGGIIAFPISFLAKSNVVLGLVLFPFTLFISGKGRLNFAYLFICLCLLLFSVIYNVRSLYFIGVATFVVVVFEFFQGKVNVLILFLIVFMSPLFEHITLVLGFPIRLQLSEYAGYILRMVGMEIQVEGNIMKLSGISFSVDDACMGLNMLSISFLIGVFLLSYHFRVYDRKLSILSLATFFFGVLFVSLVSNLLRIIYLVIFEIMPENPLHELIGIGCVLSYVVCPMYFVSKWIVCFWGKPLNKSTNENTKCGLGKVVLLISLAIVVLFCGFQLKEKREQFLLEHAKVNLEGLKPVHLKNGITKLSNEEILIYIKPIPEFISSEHSPLMCWKGSGYGFKTIKKIKVNNVEIFSGKLEKKDAILFTAWWYSNGMLNTINQFEWRFGMLKGEKRFCIVNVSATNEETLLKNVAKMLTNNGLKIM